MNRDLFGPLRLPAAVLASALLLAGALVYGSGRFAGAMEDAHSALEHDLTEANIRLQRMRNQETNFRYDAAAYQQLEAQGLRGPEQRLAWVGLVATLEQQIGLTRVDYQLAMQRPYAVLPVESGPSLQLSATAITLHAEGVHEGRLLDFLEGLRKRTPGLLVLRSCRMEGQLGPVRADCSLDWITLQP